MHAATVLGACDSCGLTAAGNGRDAATACPCVAPAGEGEAPGPAAERGPEGRSDTLAHPVAVDAANECPNAPSAPVGEVVTDQTQGAREFTPPAPATEVDTEMTAAAPQSSAGAQAAGALEEGPADTPPNPAAAVPPSVAACMDKRMLSASLLTHPPVEPPAWVRNLPAKGPGKLKPSSVPETQQAGAASSGRWLAGEPPTVIDSEEEGPPAPTTLAGGVTVPLGFFGEARVWVDVGLACLSRGWPTIWLDTAHVDYACCRSVALAGQGVLAVPSNNMSGVCTGDAGADWSGRRTRCLARWLYNAHVFEAVCVLVPVPRNGHWALAVIWHPGMRPRLHCLTMSR